ncbi:YceI family protein [Alteromonas oceanisediminis]|uniref:YceI family protein n=1 Tax=Alteromonas oceanisediminis TaxID=2836180 RepID=UPI001BDB5E73|nr:YceI family protein [Alteromonas oceanisediminis]MBT0587819.1 YceI family protein [Alteromonas oceanisediminis]
MKLTPHLLPKIVIVATLSLTGCISWVFAKSTFNEMPSGEYTVDLTHASIVWKVSHLGLSDYTARFADFDASITFDANNIEKSTVTATINPMSIQTAYPNADEKDFDNILATDEAWFNAGKFANITFRSTGIDMLTEQRAEMSGELTFLGVTKPVTLDVEFNGAMQRQPFSGKPTMGFSATTTINRSEWGMTKYVPNIGDSVDVMIEGEFIKTDE